MAKPTKADKTMAVRAMVVAGQHLEIAAALLGDPKLEEVGAGITAAAAMLLMEVANGPA